MARLTQKTKQKLNTLAELFYYIHGYNCAEEFDFSASYHPLEKACWNKAVSAYAFLHKKPDAMQWQVGSDNSDSDSDFEDKDEEAECEAMIGCQFEE